MAIQQQPLPYELGALEPHMSTETLQYHYGKHHKTYVEKTNQLIQGTRFDNMELSQLVLVSYEQGKSTKVYNNAAQAWNHDFFWKCLSPHQQKPSDPLKSLLAHSFGSYDDFLKTFTNKAVELFGSGWTWLVKKEDGTLGIVPMSNAGTPLVRGEVPLLTCDVWEHAYYIDHRNERPKFLESFWNLVNWEFVEKNLEQSPFTIREPTTELKSSLLYN
ncbi:MAG: superoxide dismutase [Bdellovibrionales bacterium]